MKIQFNKQTTMILNILLYEIIFKIKIKISTWEIITIKSIIFKIKIKLRIYKTINKLIKVAIIYIK